MNKLLKLLYKDVPKDTRYNLGRDCIGNFFSGMFAGLYTPFIGIIARKFFHASPLEISILQSAGFFTGIIGLIVASFVPVNQENKIMAYMGMIGALFIMILAPFIPYDKSYLFLIMCLGYNVCASFGPLYMVIIGRIYRSDIMASMLAISKPFMALTSIIMTAIATMVINKNIAGYDVWRILFVIGGIAICCNMYFCFYKIKMPIVEVKNENPLKFIISSFKILNTDSTNTWLIVSGIFYTIAHTTTNTLAPIYQNDVLKMDTNNVAFLILIQNIAWLIGYRFFGKFISKMGKVNGWLLTCSFGILMALGYILCPNNWHFLLFFYIFFGLYTAGNDIAWLSLVLSLSNKENVNLYQSLHYFFFAIRGLIGIFVATKFINLSESVGFSYKFVFIGSIVALIISMIIVSIIFRKNK